MATTFLINGVLGATWASRIPAVKHSLALDQAGLGIALLGAALGALVAMNLAGYLAGRFGSRPVTTATTLAFCCVLPLLALAPSALLLFGALVLFGATSGSMDVAMNTQGVAVESAYGRPILAAFHGMYSLGGLVGALAGGLAAAAGMDPTANFTAAAAISLCAGFLAGLWLLPTAGDVRGLPSSLRLPSRGLLVIGLIAFCTVLGEGAVADWSAVYLRFTVRSGAGPAALGFAAFSLLMAVSRFTGDGFNSRFGPTMMVRAGGLLSASGILLAISLPQAIPAIIGFGIAGAGFAVLFPIAISSAGRSREMASGASIAAVSTCGYFGYLIGPPAIGFIAQATSLRLALGLVVLLSLVAASLAGATRAGQGSSLPEVH